MIEHETEDILERITGKNIEILPGTPHFSIDLTMEQVLFLDAIGYRGGYRSDSEFYWRKHWRPTKPYQVKRLTHELMGILGVSAKTLMFGREWYSRYFVDPLNIDALDATNISGGIVDDSDNWSYGPFRKILEQGDVNILRAVWQKDQQLRDSYSHFWIPGFHATEISKLAGVEPSEVRDAIPRLAGLLARKFVFDKPKTRIHLFVPAVRRPDVEKVLAQY